MSSLHLLLLGFVFASFTARAELVCTQGNLCRQKPVGSYCSIPHIPLVGSCVLRPPAEQFTAETVDCECRLSVPIEKSREVPNLDTFYANEVVQVAHQRAYALVKHAIPFHTASRHSQEKERIVEKLRLRRGLVKKIVSFEALSNETQTKVLRDVFAALVQVLGIKAPTLKLEAGPQQRAAFFEFDPSKGGAGTVYIDPANLLVDPYETLILLIHETRHSAQFQLSQSQIPNALVKGYRAAFRVQHEIFESGTRVSFCDFSSLLNEHEAFEFANYLMNRLTGGKVNRIEMGTMASQFNGKGEPYLDVLQLLKSTADNAEMFQTFNDLMKVFRPIR